MKQGNQSGLIYPYGPPLFSGQIKTQAEDFKVCEQLGFDLSGSGEHLFLFVEKRNLTTQQLIQQLSAQVDLHPRNIGYSGLKDKQAVTRQWISLHLPGCKQIPEIPDTNQYRVLESQWHDKKLRIGVHRSNQFNIVIRNLAGQSTNLEGLLEKIKRQGFANYFGEQRFGRQGSNVEQALRVLNNRHKRKRLSRHKQSLYISSLRSELFNQILKKRIEQGIWQQPVEGDVYMLNASQSIFSATLNTEIRQRYNNLDIHCAIPLYGTGDGRVSGQASQIENEVIDSNKDIQQTLESLKIKASWRPNRALVKDLQVKLLPELSEMTIQVELNRGVYLTTLLGHFIEIPFTA